MSNDIDLDKPSLHDGSADTVKYSESDLRHLVTREVMKYRLDDVERMVIRQQEEWAKDAKDIKDRIDKVHEAVRDSKDVIRAEIERDFVSRTEFFDHLNKHEKKMDEGFALLDKAQSVNKAQIITAVAVLSFLIPIIVTLAARFM